MGGQTLKIVADRDSRRRPRMEACKTTLVQGDLVVEVN